MDEFPDTPEQVAKKMWEPEVPPESGRYGFKQETSKQAEQRGTRNDAIRCFSELASEFFPDLEENLEDIEDPEERQDSVYESTCSFSDYTTEIAAMAAKMYEEKCQELL